ncbi:hypothetical protein BH18THE2_BH18THE2_34220 [soil metagenome]
MNVEYLEQTTPLEMGRKGNANCNGSKSLTFSAYMATQWCKTTIYKNAYRIPRLYQELLKRGSIGY